MTTTDSKHYSITKTFNGCARGERSNTLRIVVEAQAAACDHVAQGLTMQYMVGFQHLRNDLDALAKAIGHEPIDAEVELYSDWFAATAYRLMFGLGLR